MTHKCSAFFKGILKSSRMFSPVLTPLQSESGGNADATLSHGPRVAR